MFILRSFAFQENLVICNGKEWVPEIFIGRQMIHAPRYCTLPKDS